MMAFPLDPLIPAHEMPLVLEALGNRSATLKTSPAHGGPDATIVNTTPIGGAMSTGPRRLADLNPQFYGAGGEGIFSPTGRSCPVCPAGAPVPDCRRCFGRGLEYEPAQKRQGIGLAFDCPCDPCTLGRAADPDARHQFRHYINFANPIDGGPLFEPDRPPHWQRQGDTFDTLQLTPSILSDPAKGGCGWHGFVGTSGAAPGEVITV